MIVSLPALPYTSASMNMFRSSTIVSSPFLPLMTILEMPAKLAAFENVTFLLISELPTLCQSSQPHSQGHPDESKSRW
jgi:hypothetical protein